MVRKKEPPDNKKFSSVILSNPLNPNTGPLIVISLILLLPRPHQLHSHIMFLLPNLHKFVVQAVDRLLDLAPRREIIGDGTGLYYLRQLMEDRIDITSALGEVFEPSFHRLDAVFGFQLRRAAG
ncbi:hypothetical protein I7I53_08306 [Histoplasma capsulatum var. duboisii H88]|uniref:Uncharacterized protein n=1 Tax=Ajellomyces capsulatus (strain H88) TaxID=544711 RepID=A0A8A1LFF3_AJEC8|nr:hypothetical protein I7I53_08306 [Histoplasma capsulatum var. duboisii H88]